MTPFDRCGLLDGIAVLDLSQGVAGPYCTRLMAGLGADVVKVEPPGTGDVTRRLGPFYQDDPHPEKSVPFLYLNTGKRSVTLDLETASGRHILRRLASTTHLIVESFPPGTLDGWGLGYADLERENPALVLCSVTPFGQTGPYSRFQATEMVAQAASGLMYITGDPEREPVKTGGHLAGHAAGQTAFLGAVVALYHALMTGQGQHVDISEVEASTDLLDRWMMGPFQGQVMRRLGKRHQVGYPHELFPCQDGHAYICNQPSSWSVMTALLGRPDLDTPRYQEPKGRMADRAALDPVILEWTRQRTKKEVFQKGQAHRMAFGYAATVEDLVNSEQLQERQFFVEVDHPCVGAHQYPGPPFRSSAAPWRHGRAPLLSEHTAEVLLPLGYSRQDLVLLRAQGVI
ncbi:MAG: CoA transferase [Chloroflexi bacterium]|nr:CoA transferase [Chloroflexota bacterium]